MMKKITSNIWYYIQLFSMISILISFLILKDTYPAETKLIFGNYIFPISATLFIVISTFLNYKSEVFNILYIIYTVAFYAHFGNNKVIYLLLLVLAPVFCMIRIYQLYKRRHPFRKYLTPVLFITFVYFYLSSLVY